MTYQCFDVELHEQVVLRGLQTPGTRNSMLASFWYELPAQTADGVDILLG